MSSVFAYVGCRTTRERNARGKGIGVYAVDPLSGTWERVESFEPLDNPSFLVLNDAQDVLYVVHGDGMQVSSFAIDQATARLRLLNRQPCQGRNPVHLALSRSGDALVVANYATGSVSQLPIEPDGAPGRVLSVVDLPGTPGPHRIEQTSSHPHHIARFATQRYNTDWHIVPDKGLDTVFVVKWSGIGGMPVVTSGRSREGAGPRHAAFHPKLPIVYVANELDSTLTAWAFEPLSGTLEPLHTISVLPAACHERSRAAGIAIHPNGRTLYVSNRGHDSIATVGLDDTTGIPLKTRWTDARGECPRFLCLSHDARMLYVANELSDSIVQYLIDANTGTLSPTDHVVSTGSPVCIVFKTR
ncbi:MULTISPECIES: lactonase family protein [Paraburkholderia]|uniref:lactonase family protein n=1 Tax=Paraburkholderia TaxID=1822464 RepID=UPI002253D669|nr:MULTISPECIES: lactonase family protein [Paraburkholderia]MCX4163168.1 lactonase family protein [Paraburkholderia megapolitana]MDN7158664.1 lactonase family protein [Paraburkholderia sp. CHISQ3]MDQ6495711.1 lactonase family protein [Paraburkholderia megapolitana]